MGDKQHPYFSGLAPETPEDIWRKTLRKSKHIRSFPDPGQPKLRKLPLSKGRNWGTYYSVCKTIRRNNFLYSYMKSRLDSDL